MKSICLVTCTIFLAFTPAVGQQTVTTSGGSVNSVPKFSGSATIVNSAITENNGQVGIGTVSPQATLHVAGNNVPGMILEPQDSLHFGTVVCCGAGPTGSSLGSTAGWSSFFNGTFLNSNGTASGGFAGAQFNTSVPSWRMALGSGSLEWPGADTFAIGRVAPGGNYSAPSILFTVSNSGFVKVTGGIIFPNGTVQTTAAGSSSSGGTITGVTAGAGLTGGGTSGTVALAVDGTVVRNNLTNTFTAQQTFSNAPITVNNSAVLIDNEQNAQYGVRSTVLSGIAGGLWNKNWNDASWATGSVIAGWAGPNQIQVFHVDTTGTTFTYNTFVAGGLDYAELVQISGKSDQYEAGDVLVIDEGGTSQFTISTQSRSRLIAGVYSTKPGILGSTHPMDPKMRNNEIPLALVGRVPCKVSAENGPIRVGDLLVTSSTPGHAMRADEDVKPGTILGKALEPLEHGVGKIKILVILQ